MSSNAIGTLFRIGLIMVSLVLVWLIPTIVLYYLVCLVIGIEFSLEGVFVLFGLVIVLRAFYPKNVFES